MDRKPTSIDLDDLDRKILRALSDDARKSYRVIAKALRTSIGTVSARIKRLETTESSCATSPSLRSGA